MGRGVDHRGDAAARATQGRQAHLGQSRARTRHQPGRPLAAGAAQRRVAVHALADSRDVGRNPLAHRQVSPTVPRSNSPSSPAVGPAVDPGPAGAAGMFVRAPNMRWRACLGDELAPMGPGHRLLPVPRFRIQCDRLNMTSCSRPELPLCYPDILKGEIRDSDTARMAVNSASSATSCSPPCTPAMRLRAFTA